MIEEKKITEDLHISQIQKSGIPEDMLFEFFGKSPENAEIMDLYENHTSKESISCRDIGTVEDLLDYEISLKNPLNKQ